jgi:hypothetical protein
MARTSDPAQIDNPELRELAMQAAWVATLEDAVGVLEDIVVDADDAEEEPPVGLQSWEVESLAVALDVVRAHFEDADRALEERVIKWLAQDPEHWPIFRLVVLDPWQHQPGHWQDDVPGWARSLGTNTILAHFHQDPHGRGEPSH